MPLRTIPGTRAIGLLAMAVAWGLFLLFPRRPFDHSWRIWAPAVLLMGAWYLLARGAKTRWAMVIVNAAVIGSLWAMIQMR